MSVIRRTYNYKSFNISSYMTSGQLILMAVLIPYVLAGNSVTAEGVFLALGLYTNVR